ncbi:MAG TPA: hypothetical protein ENN79_12350 [Desulfobacteraceae bacterium]|nr:hypothetical protein [Desulfobacteraceae bacterium]
MKRSARNGKGRSFWQAHVRAQAASGLTQREYCRRNSISYWSFSPWKRRIEREGTGFYEVLPAVVRSIPTENRQIEISINASIKISVPDGFSSDTLREILSVLDMAR